MNIASIHGNVIILFIYTTILLDVHCKCCTKMTLITSFILEVLFVILGNKNSKASVLSSPY